MQIFQFFNNFVEPIDSLFSLKTFSVQLLPLESIVFGFFGPFSVKNQPRCLKKISESSKLKNLKTQSVLQYKINQVQEHLKCENRIIGTKRCAAQGLDYILTNVLNTEIVGHYFFRYSVTTLLNSSLIFSSTTLIL